MRSDFNLQVIEQLPDECKQAVEAFVTAMKGQKYGNQSKMLEFLGYNMGDLVQCYNDEKDAPLWHDAVDYFSYGMVSKDIKEIDKYINALRTLPQNEKHSCDAIIDSAEVTMTKEYEENPLKGMYDDCNDDIEFHQYKINIHDNRSSSRYFTIYVKVRILEDGTEFGYEVTVYKGENVELDNRGISHEKYVLAYDVDYDGDFKVEDNTQFFREYQKLFGLTLQQCYLAFRNKVGA